MIHHSKFFKLSQAVGKFGKLVLSAPVFAAANVFIAVLTAVCLVAFVPHKSYAQDTVSEGDKQELENLNKSLEQKSLAIHHEIQALRKDTIMAAKATQDLESQLLLQESRLVELEKQEVKKRQAMNSDFQNLTHLLGMLQRLRMLPRQSVLVAPDTPITNARRASLIKAITPYLEKKLTAKRAELKSLLSTQDAIVETKSVLEARAQELTAQKRKLDHLIAEKQSLEKKTRAETVQVQKKLENLANDAASIQDFVTRLSSEKEKVSPLSRLESPANKKAKQNKTLPEPQKLASLPDKPKKLRPFPKNKASLLPPVRGEIISFYGEKRQDSTDPFTKGITIRPRSGAKVVAPFDGHVVYTGPFRGYGLILIIEHEGRYHSLLAGLDTIYVSIGQIVLSGEPVGEMGKDQTKSRNLYLELRQDVKPINPLPWLTKNSLKVRS